MNDDTHTLLGIASARDLAALQAQMQRPAQNANLDGSFELGWGSALLCFGLIPYLNAVLPKSLWTSSWTAWIGYLPLLCAALAPYAVPKIVKRFVTWPRTGYVANPNEVTLRQLLTLMAFGAALGFALSLPFVLVSEVRFAIGQPGVQSAWNSVIWHTFEMLVCTTLVVYLGPKVIRKRPPPPTAYDAALIQQKLCLTPAGRNRLRVVRGTVVGMFVGIPVCVIGVLFAFMYFNNSVLRHAEVSYSMLGFISFLVGTNAILYLMGNAVAIRQYRWKWLVLPLMLLASILIAPAIPFPIDQQELSPIFHGVPPVLLAIGTVWFLSGAATLICFTRRNPLPITDTP